MRASLLLLGAASLVAAQNSSGTDTSKCCDVNPGSVDSSLRLGWCRAQKNTCPELCTNGQVSANTCDSDKLTYTCTCSSGNQPNISDFGQTLPSLQCDKWKEQCIGDHPNDLAGQNFCLSFNCGSKNATAEGAGAGSSTGGSSSGGSKTSSSSSSSPSATSSTSAANVLAISREYGTGALLLAISGLFAFAL